MRSITLHLTVEAICEDEVMGHFYSVGFHGVGGAVVEVSYVGLVEVGDALFRRRPAGGFGEGCCCRGGCRRHGSFLYSNNNTNNKKNYNIKRSQQEYNATVDDYLDISAFAG
jgi:hypothetical protein